MTLNEIAYMILEQIKSNKIVDDEEIDLRLVKSWIKLKRTDIIKNKAVSGQDINLNNAQAAQYSVSLVPSYTGTITTGVYNCDNGQDFELYKSTVPLSNIVYAHGNPLIIEITSEDKMRLPFSLVTMGQLRFSGNSRFTNNLIFGAVDVDKYLYFKKNSEFVTRPNFVIKAVFEDPTTVPGFNEDTDDYPCSLDIIEAVKNSVFDKDFRVLLNSVALEDNENNANDEA